MSKSSKKPRPKFDPKKFEGARESQKKKDRRKRLPKGKKRKRPDDWRQPRKRAEKRPRPIGVKLGRGR